MAKFYYSKEIKHEGLNEYKIIKGETSYELERKARIQLEKWDEFWNKKLAANKALELTEEAQKKLDLIKNVLTDSLKLEEFSWDNLKSNDKFSVLKPEKKSPYSKEDIGIEPRRENYAPKIGIMDKVIKSKMDIKIKEAEEKFLTVLGDYNEKIKKNKRAEKDYIIELQNWEKRKNDFYDLQEKNNSVIDLKKDKYEHGEIETIKEYINLIISNSYFPINIKKEFKTDFNTENKILIVDFVLPEPEKIPKLKEVKYNKIQDTLIEYFVSDSEHRSNYDDFIYQVSLKFLNNIFKSDYANHIESIVFNGWINTIDSKTGKDITLCLLSIQTSKKIFEEINLAKINPKECFKGLKGVSSAKLHTITPIAPILQLDKTDKRFISSYEVMGKIDDSENIAAMDWEDFEHLIREIFEKEFISNGGEVKVTQSSRDGGVDAIAFDPDPIRGGKIVIQAKRYTNVVGVSAVRDLFGTVMNEGATKGILVTTADYGSDAYEFAKGKPITLLNGSNLLNLLEKHGHKAKIDLKEAKLLIEENRRV